jgi:hypothetical protein
MLLQTLYQMSLERHFHQFVRLVRNYLHLLNAQLHATNGQVIGTCLSFIHNSRAVIGSADSPLSSALMSPLPVPSARHLLPPLHGMKPAQKNGVWLQVCTNGLLGMTSADIKAFYGDPGFCIYCFCKPDREGPDFLLGHARFLHHFDAIFPVFFSLFFNK